MDRAALRKLTPALVWMTVISALSNGFVDSRSFVHSVTQAAPKLATEQGFSDFWSQWWWVFVKGWHVTEFFLLTLLLHRATSLRTRSLVLPAFLAVSAAMLDEWHQTFIPRRGGHLSDVMIDTIGVVLAVVWIRYWVRPSVHNYPRRSV